MSRLLERATATTPNAVQTNVLTVPAGHKYEVTDLTCITDSAVICQFLLLATGGPSNAFFDDITVPAGKFAVEKFYQGLVFYAGEHVGVIPIYAGTHTMGVTVCYVDVDFT